MLEAALAALYLEHGFEKVAGPLVDAFEDRIQFALFNQVDFKTELQETLARRGPQRLVLAARRGGPAASASVHGGRGGRGPRARDRSGHVEEGGRAGRSARGAHPPRAGGGRGRHDLRKRRVDLRATPSSGDTSFRDATRPAVDEKCTKLLQRTSGAALHPGRLVSVSRAVGAAPPRAVGAASKLSRDPNRMFR